jgi:membrane protein DedA with SNARE-associated domain
MLQEIWQWLTDMMGTLGYGGVVSLMALESSFFPFPSEVVVPPAAASARSGELSLILVIVAGIVGSLIGALFNYWLAVKVGRPFLLRYGKYVLISEKNFHRSEAFFRKHGEIATFVGRLLPGIRQLISFPAGLARMSMGRFLFFTTLGSGIWVVVLALVGYWVGDPKADPHAFKERANHILLIMIPALVILVVGYVIWQRKRRRDEPEAANPVEVEP